MKKVLIVGMLDSVHLARWLEQFKEENIEFFLFPSSPMRRIHPLVRQLIFESGNALYHIPSWAKWAALPLWLLDKAFSNSIRAQLLRYTVRKFKPTHVHLIEFQNAGYIGVRAFAKFPVRTFKLICTNYGSDIFWFRQFPAHLAKIRALLRLCDIYSAECERDVQLARNLGFKGQVMPVRPNAGGFKPEVLRSPLSEDAARNLIMVKGYHGWVGRAKIALEAIRLIQSELKDLELVVFSSNGSVARDAEKLGTELGLAVRVYKKGTLPHETILELFSQAKVYIGLSLSDGISTSLLEAMAMGAIPVQTYSACCSEWFSSSGVIVRDLRPVTVANSIREALGLSKVEANRIRNRETVTMRASDETVRQDSLGYYT